MKSRSLVCCAITAIALAGCASTPPSQAETRSEPQEPAPTTESNVGRNAGQVAGACVMMLKAGLLGVPIMLACLPLVPLAAVGTALNEALPSRARDGTGAPDFAYPSSAHLPRAVEPQYLNAGGGNSGFAYPNSHWGCYGRCR